MEWGSPVRSLAATNSLLSALTALIMNLEKAKGQVRRSNCKESQRGARDLSILINVYEVGSLMMDAVGASEIPATQPVRTEYIKDPG